MGHSNANINLPDPPGERLLNTDGDVFAIVKNSVDFCGKVKPPCSRLVEYGLASIQLADNGRVRDRS